MLARMQPIRTLNYLVYYQTIILEEEEELIENFCFAGWYTIIIMLRLGILYLPILKQSLLAHLSFIIIIITANKQCFSDRKIQ